MDLHHLSQIVEELWNGWELRILMLLSLFLQTILALFGDRRKYATGFWLRFVVWLAYMSADWVATFSLGILARSQTNSANPNLIPVFWAPILLLHLSGPETITAFSLADNELWTRRLLELVIQAGVASYVLYKLWSRNTIIFVAIPILVSGIIKYGERIWALRLATSESFTAHANQPSVKVSCIAIEDLSNDSSSEVRIFHDARLLYRTVQILSTNLLLEKVDQEMTYEIVSHKNAGEAFGLTEIELGFMYNRLYSKVTEISSLRIILHSITFLSSISALISFSIMTLSKNVYSKKDTMISYLLLVGAVLLDCYSITVFFTSDWGVLWLGGIEMPFHIFGRISFPLPAFCMKRKRWSTSMGQHSLISALSKKPVNKILKNFLGKWNVDSREKVGKELKELIFKQVLNKRSRYDPSTDDFNALEKLLEQRGLEVLRSKHCFHRFEWSVAAVEFIHSLLTWHIATHVCFSDDSRKNAFDKTRNCVMSSRSLSNYMLYLLVDCPAIVAVQLSGTRYAETTIHLRRLLSRNIRKDVKLNIPLDALSFHEAEVNAFFKKLLESPSTMLKEINEQDEGEMSALLDGCMLGLSLQSLEAQDGWSNDKKWEMISEVWVDMLMYAASHSVWKEHVHALARGGELLTHVCLLMAHLGLSKQCRPEVSEQLAARAKRLDDIVGPEV
ncbi:uncharacterized protein [Populus alba]|uniref:DUF4220 domain-containing protein n=2 Tax=Populus TaxID=3689 RepID=A0A4U5PQ18_POPAL|nr:uncharacterized protein LOC118032256 [Populus alba]KAJ6991946.1 hypothetical protein NC653_015328 [Populus alba x Populus x berolinensis]TKR98581.1 hypothetical protein D5086_0000201720 [Populus alba]